MNLEHVWTCGKIKCMKYFIILLSAVGIVLLLLKIIALLFPIKYLLKYRIFNGSVTKKELAIYYLITAIVLLEIILRNLNMSF